MTIILALSTLALYGVLRSMPAVAMFAVLAYVMAFLYAWTLLVTNA